MSKTFQFHKFFFEDISPFVEPLMFLFWSSGDVCLGSKAKEDHLLACFVTYMQWAPQIYLKIANTCWPLGGQNDRPNLLFSCSFKPCPLAHSLTLTLLSYQLDRDYLSFKNFFTLNCSFDILSTV